MEPRDEEIGSWLEREVAGCQFRDVRHGKRFVTLLTQLSGHLGGSIPFACQDWAATKAAYRFLSNARVLGLELGTTRRTITEAKELGMQRPIAITL